MAKRKTRRVVEDEGDFLSSEDVSDNDSTDDESNESKKCMQSCQGICFWCTSSRRKRSKQDIGAKNTAPDGIGSCKTVTRFSVSYFSEVINGLSEEKKDFIRAYGFGSLLDFEKCWIPLSFASWIAEHVNTRMGDIVVNNRVISMSLESIHAILGLPNGGREIVKDSVNGKPAFLKLLKMSTLPKVKDFGDMLMREDLDQDDTVRNFLVVALATFLSPSSSIIISPNYLAPLIDIKEAKKWDWCKLVFGWLIKKINKLQSLVKANRDSTAVFGGCLYYLCACSFF